MRRVVVHQAPLFFQVTSLLDVNLHQPNHLGEFVEMLQQFNVCSLSIFIYFSLIVPAIGIFLSFRSENFNKEGADDGDGAANQNTLQSFGQVALSSEKPGGGKLCQEAIRPVTIIGNKRAFFNVNFLNCFAGGIAI